MDKFQNFIREKANDSSIEEEKISNIISEKECPKA